MSPRAFLTPAIVLLAASSSACGGEGGPRAKKTDGLGPADAAVVVDQCAALSAYTFQMINNGDFLDGKNPDAAAWYINYDASDETVDGSVPPFTDASAEPNGKPVPEKIPWRCPNAMPADAGANDYALRLRVWDLKPPIDQPPIGLLPDGATMPKGGWGCLIGTNLAQFPLTFDASAWDGISFWIRQTAPAGSVGSAFVSLTDHNTKDPRPSTEPEDLNSMPCDQDSDPNTGSTVNQCDSFGTGVAVGTDWKFYALPFANMRQRGFGKAVPQGVAVASLVEMKFDFAPTQNWEIWVDGMAFYRGPPAP